MRGLIAARRKAFKDSRAPRVHGWRGPIAAAMLALSALCLAPAKAAADELASVRVIVGKLVAGGHVLYFRHAETGSQMPDAGRAVLGDCSTQRNLNEQGRAQARTMGEAFSRLGIPVGEVRASEFCRCWQHAELQFGRFERDARLSLPKSYPSASEAERQEKRNALAQMLSTPPAAGTNTVLVAHGANLTWLAGFHLGEQGEAAIFRPLGSGRYELLGRIKPGEWSKLAAAR